VSTVLVTGATGFLGEFVIARLRAGADRVVVFARPASNIAALVAQGVEVRSGDLGDQASLRRALAGVDVLVNLASLGFGHAPTIVAAAANAGLQHAVFVSTTSIYSSLPAGSKPTRIAAEQAVRDSGLPYTLLRPTMIYGSPRDRNIWRLIKYLCALANGAVGGRRKRAAAAGVRGRCGAGSGGGAAQSGSARQRIQLGGRHAPELRAAFAGSVRATWPKGSNGSGPGKSCGGSGPRIAAAGLGHQRRTSAAIAGGQSV